MTLLLKITQKRVFGWDVLSILGWIVPLKGTLFFCLPQKPPTRRQSSLYSVKEATKTKYFKSYMYIWYRFWADIFTNNECVLCWGQNTSRQRGTHTEGTAWCYQQQLSQRAFSSHVHWQQPSLFICTHGSFKLSRHCWKKWPFEYCTSYSLV